MTSQRAMTNSSDTLHFSFPTYGDPILSKMNVLRGERQFCDITLVIGAPKDGLPVRFHAHRVVLAASSDFLRDQFLLHEGQAELTVSVVSSGRVAESLLLSCYTGLLEVPLRELVSYLTAASALQMSQVVDKCTEAVSLYLSPTLAFLKQNPSRSWLDSSCDDQKEKDEVQSRNQEVKEGRVSPTQPKLKASQQAEAVGQKQREPKEKMKLTEIVLESDKISKIRGDTSHEELPESPQKPQEEEEGNIYSLIEQLQPDEDKIDSTLLTHPGEQVTKSHMTAEDVSEHSENASVQRPYLCRKCDKVFQHLESYMDHVKESKEYFCLVCKKSFSGRANLTRHICTYTAAKPFRCPLCHKTFTKKALLQDHFHLHTRETP
ncbi:Zinc finger and BTB domain-containing protein 26 [Oryzias melastigma]|uniref:Zinc finger and BTB domain-containing protein 26 n=1 Tax=Oryzias melastigma TaxID=30732 RepID=A0A834CDN0_ORYME|nr:Zinc finger and BTB domain-containing protein 26 [Oryzias melastigma]